MARPLRVDLAGGWYHVTSRGNNRKSIFRDDRDRTHFLELLAESVARFSILIHAYVLIPNHYHLLVETPQANLSRAIQWLNVSYSVWFNRRHRRAGHLMQGRFKAVVVDRDRWALSLSRHIHLNPVRMKTPGLDKASQRRLRARRGEKAHLQWVRARIEQLREYRWSSYRAYTGQTVCPPWLTRATVLGLGGWGGDKQRMQQYRAYVEQAVREGLEASPWEELEGGVVLGSKRFVKTVRKYLRGAARKQSRLRQLKARAAFSAVVRAVETWKGEPWSAFRDRYGDVGRDAALYVGRKRCGMTLAELGKAAGGIDYRSVGAAVNRMEQRARTNRALAKILQRLMEQMEKTRVRTSNPPDPKAASFRRRSLSLQPRC